MLKNNRLLKAIKREPVDCTPVWLMRQAGRYLPEYRNIRKQAGSFLELMKTPELASEVTLQPLRRFDLDAAIIFSDILTIPDAMNLGLYFSETEGPKFEKPIRDEKEIKKLIKPNLSNYQYLFDAIKLTIKELNNQVPLIGFSGSPWTLATYMIEGGSSKDFRTIKKWLYREPKSLLQLLQLLTDAVTDYLLMQIEAGVDVIMLFDSWGGVLTTENYLGFSLRQMQTVVERLKNKHNDIPIILFTKGGGGWLEQMAQTGCDALGLDWTVDIKTARQLVGHKVALQGNLEPAALYAPAKNIQQQVKKILTGFGEGSGHIFNLGHGILKDVDPDHVAVLVNAVHEYSKSLSGTIAVD